LSRLEQRLAHLRQEARFDSQGQFSLDRKRAFRLQRFDRYPEDFLLKLVQCAQLAGSEQLHLESNKHQLEVTFSAPLLKPADLWQDQSLAGQKLLSAARAATQFHSERTRWGCWDSELGWGLRYQNEELELECLRGSQQATSEVFLICHLQTPINWERLHQRCQFSQVRVFHNGKPWPSYRERGSWLADCHYWGESAGLPMPDFVQCPARLYRLGEGEVVSLSDTPTSTYLQTWTGVEGLQLPALPIQRADSPKLLPPQCLTLASAKALFARPHYFVHREALPGGPRGRLLVPALPQGVPSQAFWVKHGVILEANPLRLLLSQCQWIWGDNQLQVDASELKLIENEAFWERIEWLQSQILSLRRELRRCLNTWKAQGWPKKWVIKVLEAQHLDVKD
jgi:hypothetical protein